MRNWVKTCSRGRRYSPWLTSTTCVCAPVSTKPTSAAFASGRAALITTDSYPGHKYVGRISMISQNAEFTPKSVETHAERVTLVYRIRIDIENQSHELKPGMPADATIELSPPGSP